MKVKRSSYSLKESEANNLARQYIDQLTQEKIYRKRADQTHEMAEDTKKQLQYLLQNSSTKKATAYLVEFSLDEKGNIVEKLLMKE